MKGFCKAYWVWVFLNIWREFKCPLAVEWENYSIYTVEYYTEILKNYWNNIDKLIDTE